MWIICWFLDTEAVGSNPQLCQFIVSFSKEFIWIASDGSDDI